jgi:hypothetical protein
MIAIVSTRNPFACFAITNEERELKLILHPTQTYGDHRVCERHALPTTPRFEDDAYENGPTLGYISPTELVNFLERFPGLKTSYDEWNSKVQCFVGGA